MADYTLPCCGGFPAHKWDCDVRLIERDQQEARRKQEDEKRDTYDTFFASMSDEELFAVVDTCTEKIKAAQFWVERRMRAYDYMRRHGKSTAYLDRNR